MRFSGMDGKNEGIVAHRYMGESIWRVLDLPFRLGVSGRLDKSDLLRQDFTLGYTGFLSHALCDKGRSEEVTAKWVQNMWDPRAFPGREAYSEVADAAGTSVCMLRVPISWRPLSFGLSAISNAGSSFETRVLGFFSHLTFVWEVLA